MSRGEFDKRWMAYLDGQLSAGEASAFDETLDAAERARIEAELRLESALADCLNQEPGCPEDVWERTRLQLESAAAAPRLWLPRALIWSAAASILLALSLSFTYVLAATKLGDEATRPYGGSPLHMARLGISETCVSDFALRAATPCSREAIEQYLEEHDIRLALVEQGGGQVPLSHHVRLLGSCMGNCPKGEVVEVLFDWDGMPAKLVLARADSSGARLIRSEADRGTVTRTKVLGDYLAGVVSMNENSKDAGMLLDLLRVKNERVARGAHVNQFVSSPV